MTNRQQSRFRRKGLLLAGLGIVVLVALAALGKSDEDPSAPAIDARVVLPVSVETVRFVHRIEMSRSYTGRVRARRSSELGFQRGGRVVEVLADDGDRVEKGAALARLTTRRLEAGLMRIEAELARAEAQQREMEAGPREQTIEAARAGVRDLAEQLNLSRAKQKRRELLLQSQSISKEERDELVFGSEALAARLDGARASLDELEAGTRTEQIDAQRAVVDALRAGVVELRVDLEESTIRAPFAGRIARRAIDEGAVVQPGQSVLKIVEDRVLEAWIGIPTRAVANVTVGAEYEIDVDGRRLKTRITAILPELDSATRTVTVVMKIMTEETTTLVPGQTVRLLLPENLDLHGTWLPMTALTHGMRGLWSCLVVVPERGARTEASRTDPHLIVERRDVEILHTEEGRVLVRGTLREGERVIVTGTQRIVPGQRVRIRQAQPKGDTQP